MPLKTAEILALAAGGPAWRQEVPRLGDIPLDVWGPYAKWLFQLPTTPVDSAEASRFVRHLLQHLPDLQRWLQRNPGSGAVRSAYEAYLAGAANLPPSLSMVAGREHAEMRAGVLMASSVRNSRVAAEPLVLPRDGRRLRIGFVQTRFGPAADTYATLACLQQSDPANFEVWLFALENAETDEAARAGKFAQQFQLLSAEPAMRLHELRSAQLDVLVFSEPLGRTWSGVTELALHRIAPLQVANDRERVSTGFPTIDLYLTGDVRNAAEQAAHFGERLGVMRGVVENFALPTQTSAGENCPNREQLGLSPTDTVIAAIAPAGNTRIETFHFWSKLLSRNPEARLVVGWLANTEADSAEEFCRFLSASLDEAGLSAERVSVFPVMPPASNARDLIRLADLYIDHGLGCISQYWTIEALALGVPVITIRDNAVAESRTASTLDGIGLGRLVASTEDEAIAIATELTSDPSQRHEIAVAASAAAEKNSGCFDALAASDSFATVIETAFEELSALGARAFRSQREPVSIFALEDLQEALGTARAALDNGDLEAAVFDGRMALRSRPSDSGARKLWSQILLAQGRSGRAVEYLLPVVQQAEGDAATWLMMAKALRADKKMQEAIQTLEACLRLDPDNIDALFLLLELAEGVGAVELVRETYACLQQLAPNDARLVSLEPLL